MMTFKTASRTPTELADAKKELNEIFFEAVRKNGQYNPRGVEALERNKFDIAELIVQIIKDEVNLTDPVPFLFEERTIGLNDKMIWQEMQGSLRVTKRAYGSVPTSSRLTFKEFHMTTSQKEVNVDMPLEEIAGGRIDPSTIAEQMAITVNRFRIGAALTALDAGVPSRADRTGMGASYQLRYAGLTKANLDLAINGLMDEGQSPTVMGRHVTLFPALQGFAGWSAETVREFETRGVIGTYLGAKVNVLRDTYSRMAVGHVIDPKKVYVSSGKRGGIVVSKDVSFLNYAETSARLAAFSTGLRFEDGYLVHDPDQYRIITLP